MANIDAVKMLAKEQLSAGRDVMDTDYLRREFLVWLGDLRFPGSPKASDWDEWLEVFDRDPADDGRESGLRIWAALRLYTDKNRYLITILESFRPSDAGVYFATTHVSWRSEEKNRQEKVDKAYSGQFDDGLRQRHMLWAQTFRRREIHEALSACALAILGHELVGAPPAASAGQPLNLLMPQKASFPVAADS